MVYLCDYFREKCSYTRERFPAIDPSSKFTRLMSGRDIGSGSSPGGINPLIMPSVSLVGLANFSVIIYP